MEAFSAFTNRLTAVPGALLAGLVECTRLSAPLVPVMEVWHDGLGNRNLGGIRP